MTRRASTKRTAKQGPYSVGIWSTWMSAQPDGRPDVQLGADERAVCAEDMGESRSVVITGASRGLGFASAVHLYRQGWRVVAAMRSARRRNGAPARGNRSRREIPG